MYRRMVRQTLKLALLATFVVLAVSACDGNNQRQAPDPRPLPEEEQQALRPGAYHSEEFKPPHTFKVGQGWDTYTREQPDVLRIVRGESFGLGFTNIRNVYKPTKTGSPEVAEAPENIVGWFQQHPYLRTTEPEPVTVGGVEGVRFDTVVGKLPEGYHAVCLAIIGNDCVDIAKFSDGQMLFHTKGFKARLIILEDVEGQTVSVYYGGAAKEFDEFAPKAKKVIGTVQWNAS